MDIERVNQLKLREDEVVQYKSLVELAMVMENFHKITGNWSNVPWMPNYTNFCSELHEDKCGLVRHYEQAGYTIITAEEWLNRHNVFIHGQKVNTSEGSRIWLFGTCCVKEGEEKGYRKDWNYGTVTWATIESPHKPWVDVEEDKLLPCPLCGNTDLDIVLANGYNINTVMCSQCPYRVSGTNISIQELKKAHNRRE